MSDTDRRRFLRLLGTAGLVAVAGCLGDTDPEGGQRGEPTAPATGESATPTPGPTETATDAEPVREWASDAEPTGPTRPAGAPVSVERTIADPPGYERDNREYFPENRTMRYAAYVSGGEPAGFDTWSFAEWGRIESASVGGERVRAVTADRLGVEGVGSGVSTPPAGADTEGPVVTVVLSTSLDRDGEVLRWPVATFPELVATAPRSVDVTLTIEGDTYSRTVPVYAEYQVQQED
jgi:hypothetical protein